MDKNEYKYNGELFKESYNIKCKCKLKNIIDYTIDLFDNFNKLVYNKHQLLPIGKEEILINM